MRSKTSFFNQTLYKKNLSRFWPLWALPSFGGALIPLTMLLQIFRIEHLRTDALDISMAYYSVLEIGIPIFSLLYAVLCAAAVWSYLYNPRSLGLMHRLPIRREGLFVTNFLSGMTMMLIPYVITGALVVGLTMMMGALAPKALLLTVAGVLLESFFYFSSATFVVFLTGNMFAMPVLYFLLHFLEPLLDMLMGSLKSGFYYGVSGGYSGLLQFLCPTSYLIAKINIEYQYDEVFNAEFQERYHELVGVELQNFWVIGAYALAGVALLALAYALYRRRSSERAGDVAAVGWMRPVFRYSGALLAGLGGGLVLYTLVWRPFQRFYSDLEIVPLMICMVIMGLMGYYAVNMMLEKSLRVFRGSMPGAASVVVVLCLICVGFHFDIFGVENYVPEKDQIETVELWVSGDRVMLKSDRDDALIQKTLDMHQALVDDLDYVEECRMGGSYDYNKTDDSVNVYYEMKDGRTVHRNYSIRLTWERMQQEGTYDHLIDQLVNDPDMLLARLHGNEANLEIENATIASESDNSHQSLNAVQARQVYEALLTDAQNGCWGQKIWFDNEEAMQEILATGHNTYREDGSFDLEEVQQMMERIEQVGESFASMDIWYAYPLRGTERGSDSLYIRLRPEMSETIACLRKLGILEPDRLALVGTKTETEAVDHIPYEEDMDVYYGSSPVAESVGIIDGVDGPTLVNVVGG